MVRTVCVLALGVLFGCGGPSTAADRTTSEHRRAEARDDAPPPGSGSSRARPPSSTTARALARDATFADLARAARTLDDRRDQESDAGCLLRAAPDALELAADLAVAVRPLPSPDDDLDARLEHTPGPITVLTRYGTYGPRASSDAVAAAPPLALVGMTTSLPPGARPALALFLTDRGVYARRSDAPGGERSASRAEWIVEHAALDDFDLVAITAEAGVPLATLAALLRLLPASLAGRVALAVPLAEGTRLPEGASAADAAEGAALCPEGLPDPRDDESLGELPTERIVAGLEPLRSAAALCVGTSTGSGAAGGRVVVVARIDAGGRVREACVREDATGDPALRACLVRAARELAFDAPEGGFVDFSIPLLLQPGRAQRQLAICP